MRLLRHAGGGVTSVTVTRSENVIWDIPTERIPFHLRRIGSQFLVIMPRFTPEELDTPDDIRHLCASVEIRDLGPNDVYTDP